LKRALDEYEVSGITTTLSFFREVVTDEEFVSGRLDTGFITRFNERRASQEVETNQVESDLATIAAALSYALHRQQTAAGQTSVVKSRWKMAGRNAALGSQSQVTSSKWRKS